jgi:hypothetical protein
MVWSGFHIFIEVVPDAEVSVRSVGSARVRKSEL